MRALRININYEDPFSIVERTFLFSIIFVPFFLPFSRFLSDFFLSFSSILFLIIVFYKKDFKILLKKYSILFYLWYFYLCLVTILAYDILLSLESVLFYFRFTFYSLAIIYCIKNYLNFNFFFLISIGLSTIILLLDSYFQLFFGYNIVGYKYDNAWNRLSSFFGENYVLGSYLSRIIPFLVGLLLLVKVDWMFNKIIIPLFLFLSFIIILYSGDRSGLFYFTLFITMFLLLINIKPFYKFSFFIISILVSLVIIMNSDSIYKRMIDHTKNQIINDNNYLPFSIQHQLIYETSIKIIKDEYFFGIGPKNFREVCKEYKSFSKYDLSEDGCSTHPHNTYLQLLVETGIVGFLFILSIFIIISFYLIYKIYRINILRNYNYNLGKDIILLSLFISLWPFVPTGNFFNNWLNIIYYLPIGFIIYNYYELK